MIMTNLIKLSIKVLLSSFIFTSVVNSQVIAQDNDASPVHDHGQTMDNHDAETNTMTGMQHDHAAMGHDMATETEISATAFTTDTAGLPDAVDTEIVMLEDGDSFEITASYVKRRVGNRILRMLAYNDSIPGPVIKAEQNSTITLNFTNHTDIEQTIHSHGLRVDNSSDGVPDLTQDAVQPGETFTYTINFKDAGVFWYHPHTREDYGQELGLYGNYLIDPSEPEYWSPVNREVPLVIDDILIEEDKIADFYKEVTNFALLGRFGNEFLVNGEPRYTLKIKKGEVVRFFITNVSNVRTYNLSLPNVRTKVVGADLGKFEHEIFSDNFLLSPAERLVVEAYFENPGIYNLTHTQPDGKLQLTSIEVTADDVAESSYSNSFAVLRHNDDVVTEFKDFGKYLDADPDKRLLLTIDLEGLNIDHSIHMHTDTDEEIHDHSEHAMAGNMQLEYQPMTPTAEVLSTIQWSDPQQSDRTHTTPEIFWKLVDEDTGKVSMDIDDWTFKQGELVKIRITNDENADHIMQHPMHLHGQQFVVLAVDGMPNSNKVWKDTVLVFPGQTLDLLVNMSNTGEWMAHCHISEHLHAGMVLTFRVEDENGYAAGDEYRTSAQNAGHGH
jgi:FtsP/CotA-like multicopper oxidase with cupredoxin domain